MTNNVNSIIQDSIIKTKKIYKYADFDLKRFEEENKENDLFFFEKEEYKKILSLVKKHKKLRKNNLRYDQIDLSFLKTPRKTFTPEFAVFNCVDDCSFLSADIEENGRLGIDATFKSSNYMLYFFKDFFKELLGLTNIYRFMELTKDIKITVSTYFNGCIPACVRKNIHSLQSEFDSIYLITTADDWVLHSDRFSKTFKTPEKTIKINPIIVGILYETAYLIDSFSLENCLEEYKE